MIKHIDSSSLRDFLENEKNLQKDNGIQNAVRDIIQEVKNSGNKAFISFINKYEEKDISSIEQVLFDQNFLEDRFNSLENKKRDMLLYMFERIKKFHNQDIELL